MDIIRCEDLSKIYRSGSAAVRAVDGITLAFEQGSFTAVGTGAIYYAEFTVDDERTVHPNGYRQASTCWIVEADASNRIRLRGMDVLSQTCLCEYILENPADPANRAYTPEQRAAASRAPVFAQDAKVKTAAFAGYCSCTVPAAQSADGMPVVLYRATAYDKNGNPAASAWTIPKYYVAGNETAVTIRLSGLGRGDYEIRVVAETAYGIDSEPLTAAVRIF